MKYLVTVFDQNLANNLGQLTVERVVLHTGLDIAPAAHAAQQDDVLYVNIALVPLVKVTKLE